MLNYQLSLVVTDGTLVPLRLNHTNSTSNHTSKHTVRYAMSDYETVPHSTPRTIEIAGIEWKADTLKIFQKCLHDIKQCQCSSYTVTGDVTDNSEYSGWSTQGNEAPSYTVGPVGYYVQKHHITDHETDFEPFIEEHCEVCDV